MTMSRDPILRVIQISGGITSCIVGLRVAARYGTDNLVLLFADTLICARSVSDHFAVATVVIARQTGVQCEQVLKAVGKVPPRQHQLPWHWLQCSVQRTR